MTEAQLIAKKTLYEAKKQEIIDANHEDEILEKVRLFREEKEKEILDFEKSIRADFLAEKIADEAKINHYLELLDILIADIKAADNIDAIQETSETIKENSEQL